MMCMCSPFACMFECERCPWTFLSADRQAFFCKKVLRSKGKIRQAVGFTKHTPDSDSWLMSPAVMSPPQEVTGCRAHFRTSGIRMRTYHQKKSRCQAHACKPHPRSCSCTWLAWHPRRAQRLLRSFRFRRGQTERNCCPRPWPTCCYPLFNLGNRGQANWAAAFRQIVFAATVPRATASLPRRSPRSEGVWLGRDVKIDFCRHHGAYISHQHAERGCYG
jgi:hypothetical protein